MRILLTNDDGVNAPGLRQLCQALSAAHELTVVAPLSEQSGVSHAFTFKAPVHCQQLEPLYGAQLYAVDGTPADCVKYATAHLLAQRPQAVVSGLNLGENSGTSGIYSGTLAAAREGALWGVPAVAFSLMVGAAAHAAAWCREAARLLDRLVGAGEAGASRQRHTFYNVNFPGCAPQASRGVRATRQSLAFFDDHYRPMVDERGQEGFVLYGEKVGLEADAAYDSRAILEGYTAVTPLQLDSTDEEALARLRSLDGSAQGA